MRNEINKVLFSMNNSMELASKISKQIDLPLTKIKYERFADGEVLIQSEDTVRNCDVYIIASTSTPVNENIMELLIFIDSLKRASAKSITVILSYYGYARQDRKSRGRQPITSKLVANLLESVGIDKVIAVDLHNPSIQGFFDIPVDDLRGQYVLAQAVKKYSQKFTIVAPDHGGAVRARILSELLSNNIEIAIIDKRREKPNESEVMGLLGNVQNRDVVIIDDIIDTGGTILKAAKTLKENGAQKIIIAATHGIFSRGFELFENDPYVDRVIVTDSIDQIKNKNFSKLEVASLSGFIARVMMAHWKGQSVSDIYLDIKMDINALNKTKNEL
ncbi:ribose-phosphate pyrophosphokinase [Mycoplasma iguanae]|uniref:Ribose-phosphate pyrophosphokinase n=1 Tax=Mycoplasma iguanae TaxID=292461 RepID=A0ABY5RBD0_9MOLU|nr:ribose-phosphate pyrophosphokinase [Mycoplasma iguanae]UVD81915.1 ribose-phosphate pyrophosphokinase [Mycoplasma iguanae]